MTDAYITRLTRLLEILEQQARELERGYGGGGYDPSEATRLAGQITGIKTAINYWHER